MTDYDSPLFREERPDPADAKANGKADDARAEQADRVRIQLKDEFEGEQKSPDDSDEEMKDEDETKEDDDDPEIKQFHSADQGDSPPPRSSVEYQSPNPQGFSRDTFKEARR